MRCARLPVTTPLRRRIRRPHHAVPCPYEWSLRRNARRRRRRRHRGRRPATANPDSQKRLPLSEGRTASAESSWGGGYEAAKAVDGDADTRWAAAPGHNTGWLEVDLGAARCFSSVLLDEWATGGQRIQRYELQRLEGGSWKAFHQGTTIGPLCRLSFLPVTARRVRLNILAATAAPTLNEFQILPR